MLAFLLKAGVSLVVAVMTARHPGEKEFGQRTFLSESCPTWKTPVLEETGSLPLHVVSERGKQVHPKGVSKQTGFFHLTEMT